MIPCKILQLENVAGISRGQEATAGEVEREVRLPWHLGGILILSSVTRASGPFKFPPKLQGAEPCIFFESRKFAEMFKFAFLSHW